MTADEEALTILRSRTSFFRMNANIAPTGAA